MIHAPNGKTYIESYLRSETGNPLTKYVNLCQTPEERRDKYAYCRFFHLSRNHATPMRDWHWTKINLLIEALVHPKQLPLPITTTTTHPNNQRRNVESKSDSPSQPANNEADRQQVHRAIPRRILYQRSQILQGAPERYQAGHRGHEAWRLSATTRARLISLLPPLVANPAPQLQGIRIQLNSDIDH